MNLLMTHREDYKSLKKKDLFKIIEEQLVIQKKKIDRTVYSPLMTVRNNNRRALRKFWAKRHTSDVAWGKVKEKLVILKQLREKGL